MFQYFTFDFSRVGTSSTYDDDSNEDKYEERSKFGMDVKWLEGRHYDCATLEQYRMVGDIEMDHIIELLDEEMRNEDKSTQDSNDVRPRFRFMNVIDECETVYKMQKHITDEVNEKEMTSSQKAMYEFYNHYHDHIPKWVDWDQIQRGIDVFILYSPASGQSLLYQSLIPGFSIPKIAQVLQQTKYLAPPSTNKQVNQRLQDTGGFLMSCMNDDSQGILSSSSLRPGNRGWKIALQVRVLHAKVRKFLLNGKDRGSWDVNEFGIPINQEDMAATLLAFSVNVLSGLEFISGKSLPDHEQRDYLALWRYIGWLLGVLCEEEFESLIHDDYYDLPPLDPCGVKYDRKTEDTLIHSRAALESIIFHLMHPNELSCKISKHILRMGRTEEELAESFGRSFGSLYRSYICRKYVGNDLADALKIPQHSFWSLKSTLAYSFSYFILFTIRGYTLLTMHSKWFRQRVFDWHKSAFHTFHSKWVDENKKRMDIIARMSFSNTQESNTKSRCPFSLVMPAPTKLNKSIKNKKNE